MMSSCLTPVRQAPVHQADGLNDARRFVILYHSAPADEHWDIMLEKETALTTWSAEPQLLPLSSFQISAEELPAHRKFYLDYEGEISHNRGFVKRIDAGFYEELEPSVFRVHGQVMNGILTVQNGMMTFCPNK